MDKIIAKENRYLTGKKELYSNGLSPPWAICGRWRW